MVPLFCIETCTTRTVHSNIWPVMKELCNVMDHNSDLSSFLDLSSLDRKSLGLRGRVTRRHSLEKYGAVWMKCWRRGFPGIHLRELISPDTNWFPMTTFGWPCTNLASSTHSLGHTTKLTTNLENRGSRMNASRQSLEVLLSSDTNWFTTFTRHSTRRQNMASPSWELCGMSSLKMLTRLTMIRPSSCSEIPFWFAQSWPTPQLIKKRVTTFSQSIASSQKRLSGTSGTRPLLSKDHQRDNFWSWMIWSKEFGSKEVPLFQVCTDLMRCRYCMLSQIQCH